jgi:deoxyadenosine/deoxycytidine kinase
MEDLKSRLRSSGIRYISIEGNIGAGKTTVARLLAEETGARLFLEEVDDNPFIEKFYDDMSGYAFQAQIFFLLNRYRQQTEISQQDLFSELMVADYLFAKDTIYAHAVLGDDELVLYNRLQGLLEGRIVHPDLTVYLQADPDVLLQRIKKRGRRYEKNIDYDYITGLNEAFNHFFFHYDDSPLLIVNTDRLDFTASRDHLEDFFRRISEKFEGTRYYVPSWETDIR